LANNSARIAIAVVFLIIGLLVGYLIRNASHPPGPAPTPTPIPEPTVRHPPTAVPTEAGPTAPAKKHIVVIGPTADHLSEPKVYVSKMDPREMIWLSNEKQSLEIVFPQTQPKLPGPAKSLPPFQGMTKRGTDWVFPRGCGGGECFSGNINPDLKPDQWGELWYKYDQILAADRKDGWIVIKP
jgi:hypothetical protein